MMMMLSSLMILQCQISLLFQCLVSNLDDRIKGNPIVLNWLASKAPPRIADMLGAPSFVTARKAVDPISPMTEDSGTPNADPALSKAGPEH